MAVIELGGRRGWGRALHGAQYKNIFTLAAALPMVSALPKERAGERMCERLRRT